MQKQLLSGGPVHVDVWPLERVKAMILESKAPVIHAGAGIKWGRGTAALVRLAEKLQLPITNSAGHTDVAPVEHPLYAGGVGPRGNPVATGLVRDSDLILALGTRLGFNTARFSDEIVTPKARIVQVDIDPLAIGRYYPVALGIVGDAGAVADALADVVDAVPAGRAPWKARNDKFVKDRQQLWQGREEVAGRGSKPLHPETIYSELRKVAPRDALFTIDAGTTCLQATDKPPCHIMPSPIAPLECGNIGFSYAAGLGAKVAAPERTVISLMGDGGFGMTMGEMTTAVQSQINTIALVMDNGTWGAEIAYQRDFYKGRYIGGHVHSPRFDEVMKLCGGAGYYVTGPGETADAVGQAIKEGKPAVIHAKVDPYSLVPAVTKVIRGLAADQPVERAATLADVREYLYARPFTLAVRGFMFSRFGRDGDRFPLFMGTTELIRGYTYGSLRDHECQQGPCEELDRLTGSRVAVVNAELRFPLFQWLAFGFLPIALPPVEAAVFYDAGIAWSDGETVRLTAHSGDPVTVRTPLLLSQPWKFSGTMVESKICTSTVLVADICISRTSRLITMHVPVP